MLKIVGTEADKFYVLDTDDNQSDAKELVPAKELVSALSVGVEIQGCRYSKNGLSISVNGGNEFEVPIEVWKPIPVHNEKFNSARWLYEVSNLGNVRQYLGKGKYQAKSTYMNGVTLSVAIYANYDRKRLSVSKTVASVFVPNPNKSDRIKFLDGDRSNCSAYNLAWDKPVVHRQKVVIRTDIVEPKPKVWGSFEDCYQPARILAKHLRPIMQYNLDGVIIGTYGSAVEVNMKLGYDVEAICKACSGQSHAYSGYMWEYINPDGG